MLTQFRYDATVLGPTLRSDFDAQLRATRTNVGRDHVQRTNFAVRTEDAARFEDTLDWDTTVSAWRKVHKGPERLTYHVQYEREILETLGYLAALDRGGEFLHARTESDNWVVRMLFPDRQQFGEFVDDCRDYGLALDIERMSAGEFTPNTPEHSLTDKQREALLTAHSMGYFAVPQETSVQEISDELGLSAAAVSGRLHRGLARLVDTLSDDAP
ncbi:helix-turn-helix domain-containing protein [Halovenus salina]|uniref:Helix-turn-helix domain-containing protein n=1 Tax=Halovenus salina TaxID=1510225 RepID=A0ABD5W077_9EURY|nr:helix-turn-helix domain-containing protein [Halovenus salina]